MLLLLSSGCMAKALTDYTLSTPAGNNDSEVSCDRMQMSRNDAFERIVRVAVQVHDRRSVVVACLPRLLAVTMSVCRQKLTYIKSKGEEEEA